MKTREEAVKLIHIQLENNSPAQADKSYTHYGKVELRELMDFIYGEEPKNKEQEV